MNHEVTKRNPGLTEQTEVQGDIPIKVSFLCAIIKLWTVPSWYGWRFSLLTDIVHP